MENQLADRPLEDFPDYEERDAVDLPAAPAVFRSKFGALFLDELDKPGVEHEWLIDDILSVGDKSVVGGPSQSGKSFLAIHAGMCIATGTPFFGHNVKQGLVIYQAGEGSRGVKKRLRAWRKHHGVEFTRKTLFVPLMARLDLFGRTDTVALIEEVNAIAAMYDLPLLAIFIDTLATAAIGADENSVKDMGVVFDNLAQINLETGAHVCLVHHMNAGGEKLRGSTMIYANIDQTIFVKRDQETKIRTVKLGKQRDDDDSLSFQFELPSIGLGYFLSNGKEATSCICVPVGEREAIRRAEERKGFSLRDDERDFMRVFFEVDKRAGLVVPLDLNVPSSVRSIVRIADFRDELERQTPPLDILPDSAPDEEKSAAKTKHADRIKKQVKRMGEKLKGFGVIGNGQHQDTWFMWWTGKPLRAFPQTAPPREEETAPPVQIGAGIDF